MSFMNNIYLLPNLFSPKREKLLLYELLASLNDYTLVCLTYLLTCEVECRSILQCSIGCDVVDACGYTIQRVDFAVHVNFVGIIELLQFALYNNLVACFNLVSRCEISSL